MLGGSITRFSSLLDWLPWATWSPVDSMNLTRRNSNGSLKPLESLALMRVDRRSMKP